MTDPNEKTEVNPEIPTPERSTRRIFQAIDLWAALCNGSTQKVAWDALAAAVATAHGLIQQRTCCIGCRGEWAADTAPAGVVLTEAIRGDPVGWVMLVCRDCWTGKFDEYLRAAVAREFDQQPTDLVQIHTSGRA